WQRSRIGCDGDHRNRGATHLPGPLHSGAGNRAARTDDSARGDRTRRDLRDRADHGTRVIQEPDASRALVVACRIMPASAPSLPPSPTRVLVVDDEPGLRHVLEVAFRRQGYEVVSVPGVRAALEALRQNPQPFPLVLTDLVMPDGSG